MSLSLGGESGITFADTSKIREVLGWEPLINIKDYLNQDYHDMKKGFVCGVFDIFHAGHALMLKECANKCDYLILALNTENIDFSINPGKIPPLYSIEERVLILESCLYVDEVVVYNSESELAK